MWSKASGSTARVQSPLMKWGQSRSHKVILMRQNKTLVRLKNPILQITLLLNSWMSSSKEGFILVHHLKEGITLPVSSKYLRKCQTLCSHHNTVHLKVVLRISTQVNSIWDQVLISERWTKSGTILIHQTVIYTRDRKVSITRLTCMTRADSFRLDILLSGIRKCTAVGSIWERWCIWVHLI